MHRLLELDPATGRVTELGAAESRDLLETLLSAGLDSVYQHAYHDSDLVLCVTLTLMHPRSLPTEAPLDRALTD